MVSRCASAMARTEMRPAARADRSWASCVIPAA
jgi:hypothetical protein